MAAVTIHSDLEPKKVKSLSLHPWDFSDKSTGMGCHFLLQGIFLTQESNPGLLHCRQMLFHLSHQGSLGWKPEYGTHDHTCKTNRRLIQNRLVFAKGESGRMDCV